MTAPMQGTVVKVAVVLLAAALPLALSETEAGGVPVVVQVKVRAWPWGSEPATLRLVVVPVTGLGVALAGVVTTGGWPAVTVTVAVPVMLLIFDLTVAEPVPEEGALYRPLLLIEPGPVAVQVKVGWLAIGLPNWSRAMALNCCPPPSATLTAAGVTPIAVKGILSISTRRPMAPRASLKCACANP